MARGIGGQIPHTHTYTWADIPEVDQDAIKAAAAQAAGVEFFEDLDPDERRKARKLGSDGYWRST